MFKNLKANIKQKAAKRQFILSFAQTDSLQKRTSRLPLLLHWPYLQMGSHSSKNG